MQNRRKCDIIISYNNMTETEKKICGFSSLGSVLNRELDRTGIGERLREHRAVINWHKIAGDKLSRHTKAIGIHEHRLFVKVDSPILRNELTFIKPDLLKKIRKEFPESKVEDIDFR